MKTKVQRGFRWSSDYDGVRRRLYSKECRCGKAFWVPLNQRRERVFCSRDCVTAARTTQVRLPCARCGASVFRQRSKAARWRGKVYCGRSCQMEDRRRLRPCPVCGKPISGPQSRHCSNACRVEASYRQFVTAWKAGSVTGGYRSGEVSRHLRRYLFEKFQGKCAECGWCRVNPTTGRVPLTVHHVDGNCRNHTETNLTLLCPGCHSMTPSYGALNMGKSGRWKRTAARAILS
jgi:hypothetical protein